MGHSQVGSATPGVGSCEEVPTVALPSRAERCSRAFARPGRQKQQAKTAIRICARPQDALWSPVCDQRGERCRKSAGPGTGTGAGLLERACRDLPRDLSYRACSFPKLSDSPPSRIWKATVCSLLCRTDSTLFGWARWPQSAMWLHSTRIVRADPDLDMAGSGQRERRCCCDATLDG